VLAGNAYQRLEMQRLSGLVFPAGSFIIATEPLTDAEIAEINPQDWAFCDPNYVLDYFRLSADKRLLFGGRCNYSGRVPDSIKASIQPRMLKVFPQLKGKRIDFEWGGIIGIVVNRVPLIGRLEKNVYTAWGYSGHGVNMTHATGEIIADAIGGTMEKIDLFEKIKHQRIPFGQALGSQMVALGMMYFRLLDLL
jgi:gamma-glutamylputrescine oxidase